MTTPSADLDTLAGRLRTAAGKGGTVVLDDSVVGSGTAAALAAAFALPDGQRLTIKGVTSGDIVDPVGGVLTVDGGTATVLKVADTPVTLTFTVAGGALRATVTAAMTNGWHFTDSFPGLTVFPFDTLTVSGARFVYATDAEPAFVWPGESTRVALEPGLNLLCRLGFGGVSLAGALLGEAFGTSTWPANGPFAPVTGEVLPVGTLSAPIDGGQGFSIGHTPYELSLSEPRVAVRIGTTDDLTPVQEVDLLVEGVFQQKLSVSVSVPVEGGVYTLSTAPLTPGDGSVASLLNDLPLPGGAHITSYLPAELTDVFSAIGLDDFSLAVTAEPMAVAYAGVSVSTLKKWQLIPDALELDGLRLVVETLDPSGLNWTAVTVTAEATLLPQIFPDPFEFTAEIDKTPSGWEVGSVGGAYPGTADLGDLVAGLTGDGDSLPQELRDIVLADIRVTATRPAADQAFSYTLHGSVEAALPVHGTALTARLDLTADKTSTGHSVELTGSLVIGEETFGFDITLGTDGASLDATWSSGGSPLEFADIAGAFGWTDPPELPGGLDLALTGAGFRYDFTSGALVLTATSKNYGQLVLAGTKTDSGRAFLLDLAVPLDIKLSDLPVAGPQIPASVNVGIQHLEIAYASEAWSAETVTALNTTLQALHGSSLGYDKLDKGLILTAGLTLGTETRELVLPLTTPGTANSSDGAAEAVTSGSTPAAPADTATPAPTAATPPAQSGTTWITVGRSFGPLHLDRIGIQYTNGVLFFLLDADIALGPLALSLDGLGVGSSLKKFDPEFALTGLSVSYDEPPLSILGAILRVPDAQLTTGVKFQFDGELVVQYQKYSLGALGSYAQFTDGTPSLFVFVQLEAPLGGPPPFFVTGLMGGFGFNRTLVMPGQDEVTDFPLLLLSTQNPGGSGASAQGPDAVLKIMEGQAAGPSGVTKKWITPQAGEYWLAAGLEFTTFKVVKSKAVLAVDFGNDLSIALLGTSTLRLPLDDESGGEAKPFAFVELGIRVIVQPSQGLFAASAILSPNSYVLTPDCHLTGGFAFYVWYGNNPNAGQFVTTLGGYHPAFKAPAYFPQVPRLGFNWAVSDEVSITGGAYFALTSSCAMAGGSLDAVFHDGSLRAWFSAYADFLVSWHPFFYTGDIGVSIGVSLRIHVLFFTITISLSLGASLEVWGPPTGGIVTVHIVVVSFSVSFGASRPAAATEPLDWTAFTELLPAHTDICGITLTGGLFKTRDDTASSSGKEWIVRAKQFAFETRSAVPVSVLSYGTTTRHTSATTPGGISITPMDKTGVVSTHSITIHRQGSTTPVDVTEWSLQPLEQTMPASLWAAPPAPFTHIPTAASAKILPGELVGFTVTAPPPTPGTTRGALPQKVLLEEYLSPDGRAPWPLAATPTQEYIPTADPHTVALLKDVNSATVKQARTDLCTLLGTVTAADNGPLFTGTDGDLAALAAGAGHLFSDAPLRQGGQGGQD
ncbi:hypothetical protein GCM10010387_29250 [Streptomyces inusitatus]|uniref:DUF6603 domain-containing protein n=1 Tax=Streptomyces inusitatus TaxID=68221 RepID=A0A918Q5B8_9ACTN|nr:DUF6603 domain-containing protein [Streptomyces inusitatus]GGZ33263.1 hypothetical protein GCM10010387_29250 [Streptomyces inusitatus]